MKKLTLKKINLHGSEVLTREQLKKVFGGRTVAATGDLCAVKDCRTDSDCGLCSRCYYTSPTNTYCSP